MILIDTKLSPDKGMHLMHKVTGNVFEGDIYIPNTLTKDDFEEITAEKYNQLIDMKFSNSEGENMTKYEYEELKNRIATVEATSTENSTQITQVQEALCEIYEQIEE